MDLGELRTWVRDQLDLDTTDLPNSILDIYIQDGADRIFMQEGRWPFYQDTWTMPTVASTTDYAIDSRVSRIETLRGESEEMIWYGRDEADWKYALDDTTTGEPNAWSQWDDQIRVYPTPDAVYTITIRGYRKMTDWYGDGTDDTVEPDVPAELQRAVGMWAIAQAYLREEDTGMYIIWVDTFTDELDKFQKRLKTETPAHPMILGGKNLRRRGSRGFQYRGKYDWE